MSDLAILVARVDERSKHTESRQEAHEDLCGERYGEISSSFLRVHERLDRILWSVLSLLVAIVIGGLGFVLSKIPIFN